MKKLLLLLAVMAILGLPKISAQIINSDFETWTTDGFVNAKNPNSGNEGVGSDGWWDLNMMNYNASSSFFGGSPVTVFQDSVNPSPYNGKYCAKIISATMTSGSYSDFSGLGIPYPKTNGVIFTAYLKVSGYPPTVTIKPGIPCNNEFKSFSFYYRYVPSGGSGNDTCSCTVGMYHFNSVTKKRNLVGGGYWSNSSTQTTWKQATVNIYYLPDSNSVDTVMILFSAAALNAANDPKPNDTMNIDYSSVVLGINNVTEESDKVTIYPNPANDAINLSVTGQFQASRVEVYDITGKAIGTYIVNNNFLTINTQSYSSGLHLYKLFDKNGTQLNTGKFSITR